MGQRVFFLKKKKEKINNTVNAHTEETKNTYIKKGPRLIIK